MMLNIVRGLYVGASLDTAWRHASTDEAIALTIVGVAWFVWEYILEEV